MEILNKLNFVKKLSKEQLLILIFLVALILRLRLVIILGQDQYLYENGKIARNLVSGKGYSMEFFKDTNVQETCNMAPVYPFLIAFFYLIFGINEYAILAIQILHSIIGALTIFPVYYLTLKFFSHKTAIWASIFCALYPDFIYSAYTVYQLALTTFLIPVLVYFTHSLAQHPSYKNSIYCGVLYGFSLLVEPVIISILCLYIFWIFLIWFLKLFNKNNNYDSSIPSKLKLKFLFLFVIICGLVIMPWLIRYYIVYDGQFVFIKSNGFNFWRGNNPAYTQTRIPSWFDGKYDGLKNEGDIDRLAFNRAIKYIIHHIPETVMNDLQKFNFFWWFPKGSSTQSPLLRTLLYAPQLLMFIFGILLNKKRFIDLIPLFVPLLGFTLIYSVTFVLPRYRVPIQPIMFIFAAFSFISILDFLSNKVFKLKKANPNKKID